MSSIMRARSGLTGGWVGSEIIRGAFFEPKVDGPSMLGIGRPDRHALPRITLVEIAPTTTRAPSRASGFVLRRNLAVRRSVADLEAVIGQFYLAIAVPRLVRLEPADRERQRRVSPS